MREGLYFLYKNDWLVKFIIVAISCATFIFFKFYDSWLPKREKSRQLEKELNDKILNITNSLSALNATILSLQNSMTEKFIDIKETFRDKFIAQEKRLDNIESRLSAVEKDIRQEFLKKE